VTSGTFDDQAARPFEDQDRYLDLCALSAYSSLSVRTLREYLSDAVDPIPSFCFRRKILVRKSEFDRWMSRYRNNTKSVSGIVNEIATAFSEAL